MAEPTYRQERYVGQWPMARAAEKSTATMRHLCDKDLLWLLDENDQGVLTGLYASTEHLTAGKTTILPGRGSKFEAHGGDECLYVKSGVLNVLTPGKDGQVWFEVHPQDGFFVPAGADHRYANMGGEPVEFYFGVAPRYRSTQKP